MSKLLTLYHHLPYPMRVLMASARGYQLRRLRYTPQTAQLTAAALARERRPAAQWRAEQQARLARLLTRAATQTPYYRAQWARRRRAGDRASWELLENWPLLPKEAVRANPHAFLTDDSDPKRMIAEHTSGTTGKPLHFWLSKASVRAWYALFEARIRAWHGVSRHDRWAILGGQLVTPVARQRPPFWVWNAGLNQLYLSAYHLAPGNVQAYLDALRRHGCVYILGYPSGMVQLAQAVLAQGLAPPPLKVIISNAEPLYDHQRATLAQAFNCPVVDTYGMSEIATAGSECAAGQMHLWPEVGVLEVQHDAADVAAPPGAVGRFVATGLLNDAMPLIRYVTGDRGALAPETAVCACGRTLPIIQALEGRNDDVIVTPDGRFVGRLDPVFKAGFAIREAQIIQETREQLRVRLTPAAGYGPADAAAIRRALRQRVGAMRIEIEPVTEIPRTANGKFRAVISHLTEAERNGVQGERNAI